jgi:hypothetical protein|tara:strand:+ start:123 stop:425 length:303 start_codon:yes stop_codon:yes gene_type:complete
MTYKEVTETVTTYPDLDEEEKQSLRDNPKTWRVFVTKTITEEFVLDADTQDDAEHYGREKAENFSDPDGSELEDITVDYAELDRCTYQDDEIEYIQEEVL